MKKLWVYLKSLGLFQKVIVLTAVIAIGGAGFATMIRMNSQQTESNDPPSGNIPIDPNVNQDNEGLQTMPEGDGIAIPGFSMLVIQADQKQAAVDFRNPQENEGKYYLSYAMFMKDSGELLAETDYVPAGSSITVITLTRALPAGEYDVIIRVQPCRMDGTLTNNAEMEVHLTAES
ncbi:MAG: hypothetical protein ACI32N_09300 [Bulleidia sp.]